MKTKPKAIILMVLTTIFTSSAQVLYKIGSQNLSFDIFSLITNVPLILGLMLYGVGATMMILALRHGDLSVLYPIIATSYIWVGLLSWYFFAESLNPIKWIGIFAIFFGVIFVGVGGKEVPV